MAPSDAFPEAGQCRAHIACLLHCPVKKFYWTDQSMVEVMMMYWEWQADRAAATPVNGDVCTAHVTSA